MAEEFVADDVVEKPEGNAKAEFHPVMAEPTKNEHHAEATSGKTETHHAEETAAHKEVAPPTEAPMKVAQQIAAGHTPPIEKIAIKKEIKEYDPSRIPSSIPKDVAQYSVGKFTVQIASFLSSDSS